MCRIVALGYTAVMESVEIVAIICQEKKIQYLGFAHGWSPNSVLGQTLTSSGTTDRTVEGAF